MNYMPDVYYRGIDQQMKIGAVVDNLFLRAAFASCSPFVIC
jgi:hypothetical protein